MRDTDGKKRANLERCAVKELSNQNRCVSAEQALFRFRLFKENSDRCSRTKRKYAEEGKGDGVGGGSCTGSRATLLRLDQSAKRTKPCEHIRSRKSSSILFCSSKFPG